MQIVVFLSIVSFVRLEIDTKSVRNCQTSVTFGIDVVFFTHAMKRRVVRQMVTILIPRFICSLSPTLDLQIAEKGENSVYSLLSTIVLVLAV